MRSLAMRARSWRRMTKLNSRLLSVQRVLTVYRSFRCPFNDDGNMVVGARAPFSGLSTNWMYESTESFPYVCLFFQFKL